MCAKKSEYNIHNIPYNLVKEIIKIGKNLIKVQFF